MKKQLYLSDEKYSYCIIKKEYPLVSLMSTA